MSIMVPVSQISTGEATNEENMNTKSSENKVDETTNNKPEPIFIHELKYSLNPVENIKKAKANLKRPMDIVRIVVDQENIKYDINSAAYLELKKITDKYKSGDNFVNTNGKKKLEVTKVRRQTTKKQQNVAEALVWWELTDLKSGLKTKCVQQMYHTTQGIHLQGGQKMATTTTTEVLADFLEQEWGSLLENRKESIKMTKKAIADIDIEAFKCMVEQTKSSKKASTQQEKTNLECDDCDFKTVSQIMMRKHTYIKHELTSRTLSSKRKNNTRLPVIQEEPTASNTEPTTSNTETATSPSNSPPPKKPIFEARMFECENCGFQAKVENEIIYHKNNVHEAKSKSVDNSENWNVQTLRGFKDKPTTKATIQNETEESTDDQIDKVFEEMNKSKNEDISPIVIAEALIANPVEGEVAVLITNLEKESTDKTKQLVELEKELKQQGAQLVDFEMFLLATRKQKIEAEEAKLKVVKEKFVVEKAYKECSEVVGVQQKRIVELEEKVKVMENLRRIEEMEKMKALETVENENNGNAAVNDQGSGATDEGNGWIEWQPEYMEQESRPIIYDCKKCDKVFRNEQQLRHHEKVHKRKIPCDLCNFECTESDEFIEHFTISHQAQFRRYKCDTCGKLFRENSTLVAHIVKDHGFNYTPLNQPNTNVQSKQTSLTPNGPANLVLKCHDCENIFQDKQSMYLHKRANHNKQKLCSHYHGMGSGCRFPESVCINIHGERSLERTRQATSQIPCKHGQSCTYFAQNRCKYGHMNTLNMNLQNHSNNNHRSDTNNTQNPQMNIPNVNIQSPNSSNQNSRSGHTLWQHFEARNNQGQQNMNPNLIPNQNINLTPNQNTNQTPNQSINMNSLTECVREVIRNEFSSDIQSLVDFPSLVTNKRKKQ